MKRLGSQSNGYTIVETMIFLAVSSALFIMAMAVVGGQRQKVEFTQSVREVSSQLQDVINDVATGYYATTGDFTCSHGPTLASGGSSDKGVRGECIFIGRVVSFGTTGNPDVMSIFNVVGNRTVNVSPSSDPATNLDNNNANPTAVTPRSGAPNIPDHSVNSVLPGGLTIGCITTTGTCSAATATQFGAAGFFTTFSSFSNGQLESGAQATDLIPIPTTNWQSQADNIAIADSIYNSLDSSSPTNPTNGLKICLISAGTDQHAYLIIGGSGKLSVEVQIHSGRSCDG